MRFFTTAVALSAVPAAVLAATQTVTVGDQGMLMFNPQTITAAAGDTINFEFRAKNHSVTQSTFDAPCTKGMFNGNPGVSAGFLAVPKDLNGSFPTWSITLKNVDKPLWFFCGQKNPVNHCKTGMVFSINPTADKSHDAFVAAAKASADTPTSDPASNSTGGSTPSGGSPPSGDPASAGSAPPPSSTDSTGASVASSSDPSIATAVSSSDPSSATSGGTAASSNASGSPAADNSRTSGASKTAFTRGAAGLFTVVAAVSAVLL